MNLKELRELIDIFTSRESIEELEVEKSGVRLRVRRQALKAAVVHTVEPHVSVLQAAAAAPRGLSEIPPPKELQSEDQDLFHVKAPIVGTFYKAPNPTSPPFVNIGDFVEKGAVLCIVEAMKLMNEIEAEVSGQVTAAFVENGQPVEYGERLFAIKKK